MSLIFLAQPVINNYRRKLLEIKIESGKYLFCFIDIENDINKNLIFNIICHFFNFNKLKLDFILYA